MSTTWIRVVYGIVLGMVLLLTAASGIALVLPGPKAPAQPDITFRQLAGGGENDSSQNRLTASIDQYYADARDYRDRYVTFQRNIFLTGVALAALLGAIGVALPGAVNYLRLGLLLGGAFLLVWAGWAATRSVPNPAPAVSSVLALLGAGEPQRLDFTGRFARFAVSFVGLIILLFLGLWRLTEWAAPRAKVVAVAPVSSTPAAAAAWAPPPVAATPTPATVSSEPFAPPAVDPTPTRILPETQPTVEWQRPGDTPSERHPDSSR